MLDGLDGEDLDKSRLVIEEIFPNKVRAFGQAWGCGTHWVFAAIITFSSAIGKRI